MCSHVIIVSSYGNTSLSPSVTFSSQDPGGGYRSDKRNGRGRVEGMLGLDGRRESENEKGVKKRDIERRDVSCMFLTEQRMRRGGENL